MVSKDVLNLSLYDLAKGNINENVPIIKCTKATLVHISHTIEDVVLKNKLPAMMFTGFQESSHWRKETERYRELMNVAQQVCIFAGKPLPDESLANALQVTLEGDDPLRQEWFVVILSREFVALITGKDNLTPTMDDALREFDTILSFSPKIVNRILDRLEDVLGYYRPDMVQKLKVARSEYADLQLDMDLITSVITELVSYEESIIQVVNSARNEQVIMNKQLREERNFSNLLISAAPNYIMTTQLNGELVMMNPALRNALDFPQEPAHARGAFWTNLVPNDNEHDYREALRLALEEGEVKSFQSKLQQVNGDATVDWYVTTIPRDNPHYVMWIGIDVTYHIRANQLILEEERLRLALENERLIADLRQQFMVTIAHEFRTPLATILSSTETLERYSDRLDEKGKQQRFNRVKQQVYLLTEMISDMTTILELHESRITLNLEQVNVAHFCEALLQDVQAIMGSLHKLVLQNELPQEQYKIDAKIVSLILLNLLSNAIKYSDDESKVMLTLRKESSYLTFIIGDEGIGIPDVDQPNIYEPFYRGSNVSNVSGGGLGLKLVYDCVRLYDGSVRFESNEIGTTFIIRLPIAE